MCYLFIYLFIHLFIYLFIYLVFHNIPLYPHINPQNISILINKCGFPNNVLNQKKNLRLGFMKFLLGPTLK